MATLSGDKAMEKAAARHPGEDKSLMAAGTKDRQQPLRFIRQAKAAQNQADEETTHPQAVSDPSLLDDVPGQVVWIGLDHHLAWNSSGVVAVVLVIVVFVFVAWGLLRGQQDKDPRFPVQAQTWIS
ncbi:unnamed protein product [Symbiodinium pilosum]|uniref:Uncharacterized protein n=1 Tax=Symbiodinium pilosum TaxID=2952 RepID=A0A812TFY7_SYMPI|nr:unnamed protein product [Symbiodinium pilosum]